MACDGKHLNDIFNIQKIIIIQFFQQPHHTLVILYSQGLFPSEIEKHYPDLWGMMSDDESSMNKYERFIAESIKQKKDFFENDLKYVKIIDPEVGRSFEQNVLSHKNSLHGGSCKFLDMIAHGRSDSAILKEIAPDEAAYRSLTNSWFQHSSLLNTLRAIATIPRAKVIVTTDHGSIRTLRGAKVLGDKESFNKFTFQIRAYLKSTKNTRSS